MDAGDGHSMRVHLQRVAEQTGQIPAELQGLECPAGTEHLWQWFRMLDAARSGNGFGPDAISYGEMLAWSALTGIRPTPFEAGCLRALDGEYFRVQFERAQKRRKK